MPAMGTFYCLARGQLISVEALDILGTRPFFIQLDAVVNFFKVSIIALDIQLHHACIAKVSRPSLSYIIKLK